MILDKRPYRGLTLLELAMLPRERMEQIEVLIHSIDGGPRDCVGITINGDWVRGGTGSPALFQTADAANRMMELLGVPRYRPGAVRSLDVRHDVRCYRLRGDAIALCKECATANVTVDPNATSDLDTSSSI